MKKNHPLHNIYFTFNNPPDLQGLLDEASLEINFSFFIILLLMNVFL